MSSTAARRSSSKEPAFKIREFRAANSDSEAAAADTGAVSNEEGPPLAEDHRRRKSRTESRGYSQSMPRSALKAIFKPSDMVDKPAPPPEALSTSAVGIQHSTRGATTEADASSKEPPTTDSAEKAQRPPDSSTASSTTETGLPGDADAEKEKENEKALTAFQYSDGRVKVEHPGLGERLRTYYPHEIKRIGNKNDMLKSNQEKAIEGEAQLRPNEDGKIVLTERAGYLATGYSFPAWKKWMTLFFTGLIQVSMNYNTSCYTTAVPGITEKYHVSSQAGRVGQMIYLVAYSFGCELWAPWSEEYGRKPILQLSLTLVNCFTILAALAPNFGSLIVARFFGGLFTANGGVTLAVVADLFEPDEHQFALAFMVLFSCFGVSGGAFIGGFVGQKHVPLIWNFWVQLCFNGLTQLLHFFIVPETRATILLDREARRRRRAGEANIWGPDEAKGSINVRSLATHWIRPFEMFVREPIVLFCSLLSGFSDMLIFIFQESFDLVFAQWGFGTVQVGLSFLPVLLGYVVGYAFYVPRFWWELKQRKRDPSSLTPEARLTYLLYLCPWETFGLFGFAWTSLGPPRVHWIAPMIFSMLISMANYSIYFATVDYMIAAYGPYSASACGGNALARDFLAGISAMFAVPMYEKMGYEWASTLLGFASIVIIFPIYLLWYFGPIVRERSIFAQTLAAGRERNDGKNPDMDPDVEAGTVYTRKRTINERVSVA